jgi:hypothetical protein
MTINELKQAITAARARDDRREVARLRFELPLSERNEMLTSSGRGYRGGMASVAPSGRPVAPGYRSPRAPVVQASTSWPSVELGRGIRDRLDGSYDGRENGWFLTGQILADDGEIVVSGLIAPSDQSDDTTRTGTTTTLDVRWAVEIWTRLTPTTTLLGDAHVHPPYTDTRPSSTDLRSWERLSDYFDRPWLGIIARNAPIRALGINGVRESDQLELVATLVRRDDYGQFAHRQIDINTLGGY